MAKRSFGSATHPCELSQMLALPDDILYAVFQNLSPLSLCRVAVVSKKLSTVAQDLWQDALDSSPSKVYVLRAEDTFNSAKIMFTNLSTKIDLARNSLRQKALEMSEYKGLKCSCPCTQAVYPGRMGNYVSREEATMSWMRWPYLRAKTNIDVYESQLASLKVDLYDARSTYRKLKCNLI